MTLNRPAKAFLSIFQFLNFFTGLVAFFVTLQVVYELMGSMFVVLIAIGLAPATFFIAPFYIGFKTGHWQLVWLTIGPTICLMLATVATVTLDKIQRKDGERKPTVLKVVLTSIGFFFISNVLIMILTEISMRLLSYAYSMPGSGLGASFSVSVALVGSYIMGGNVTSTILSRSIRGPLLLKIAILNLFIFALNSFFKFYLGQVELGLGNIVFELFKLGGFSLACFLTIEANDCETASVSI